MFRNPADRFPVFVILMFSVVDIAVYLQVSSPIWLVIYTLIMILPKGMICAWNHHHQHSQTFKLTPLNRLLEFFYALHTGATTNLWVLHHVKGHHRNFLDQSKDQSAWKTESGKVMGALQYTFTIALTSYYRGYRVGRHFPRLQKEYICYSFLTFVGVGALCWFKPLAGLFVFVIPMIISLLFTAWVTYDHHAGLESEDPFHASYNNTNRFFNLLTGNLGYHTAHHFQGGLHWSQLPELHEKIKHQIPQKLLRNVLFVYP